jgi:hypothetical protein
VTAPAPAAVAPPVVTIPQAVVPPSSACTPCAPATTAPAVVAPAASTCAPCAPAVVPQAAPVYAPQVRYRTTWVPVPVTRYRPVVTTDPATGCPVNTLQPCNTYTWQMRRVPVTQYRPVYASQRRCWLNPLSWFRSSPAPAPAMVPSAGCAPCAPSVVPATPAPYYAPQPGVNVVPGPAGETAPTPAQEPADTRPSLPPDTRQQASPQSASPSPAPLTRADTAASQPARSSAAGSQGAPAAPPVIPLPDPEANRADATTREEPPQLLNPRDRTARHDTWAVVPIHWPSPSRPAIVQPAAATTRQADEITWDDRGWKSAR